MACHNEKHEHWPWEKYHESKVRVRWRWWLGITHAAEGWNSSGPKLYGIASYGRLGGVSESRRCEASQSKSLCTWCSWCSSDVHAALGLPNYWRKGNVAFRSVRVNYFEVPKVWQCHGCAQ